MKKVLLGLLGVVIIIVLAIITTVWIVKANDAKNSDKQVVLGEGNSKNALIIYQNGRSSFSRKVAENIVSYSTHVSSYNKYILHSEWY